jgi:predicted AlkP superfamily phosphohydrolase/phosphomutase
MIRICRSLGPRQAAVAALWIAVAAAATRADHTDGLGLAYIGPGAGFAFLGSFLTLLSGFLMSAVSLLMLPFRILWRVLRRRQGFRKAQVRRVIFLGLDGLDPRLTDKYLAEGKLPHLAKLRDQGSYHRLRTTFPALSPVAWSTFATGVNPARHNIFDFLNRNLKIYVPELSSARVHPPRRVLKLGRLRIPLSRPWVEMRRKSKPFWKLLGEQCIASTIVRVPITFPPEKFHGRMLAAMSTPDLRGTQGSFSYFSTRIESARYESGSRYPLKRTGDFLEGSLEGPDDTLHETGGALRVPFRVALNSNEMRLEIDGQNFALKPREYTPWIKVRFRAGLGSSVHGIVRFLATETGPDYALYATPVQIDPESPALPISHPPFYAAYLAKLIGAYSTLGMAEDTWALNEGVIDEQAFLDQSYQILAERESMFRNALEKTPRGVVACVFDTSDRLQHMFFRHLDGSGPYAKTIEDLYRRMDDLVGLAASHSGSDSLLFVVSDHGFCSFRRGVNLNTWLKENGYLALKDDATESGPYFQGVDWSRTKAYTLGLAGLYLNVRGREAAGIVEPGAEAEALRGELIAKLSGLRDEERDTECIRSVYSSQSIYSGPYLQEAPDFIVGYNDGYRTSWDAAIGKTSARVIEDNCKAWSGDHAVDPHLVPGVLFSNRKIDAADPGIEDLAPTTLSLFGLVPPAWMDGKPLFDRAPGHAV